MQVGPGSRSSGVRESEGFGEEVLKREKVKWEGPPSLPQPSSKDQGPREPEGLPPGVKKPLLIPTS